MFKKFKEWRNRKPRSVRIAEAIFDLLPDEEWDKMRYLNFENQKGLKEQILDIAEEVTCVYTKEKSVEIAKIYIDDWLSKEPWRARVDVFDFFINRIFKNGRNKRTLASYFDWKE